MGILSMRKRVMMAAVNNTITVNWNQLAPAINAENWKLDRSSYSSVDYNDGTATITITQSAAKILKCRIITKNTITWIKGHKYFQKQSINPSTQAKFEDIFGSMSYSDFTINGNKWFNWRSIRGVSSDGNNSISSVYFPDAQANVGFSFMVKNILLIDLTQMFGAGKEPTVEEFEAQCALNNIDLTSPLPYDSGTSIQWKLF